MICRTCLRRTAGVSLSSGARPIASSSAAAAARTFSTSLRARNASTPTPAAGSESSSTPPNLTPLTPTADAPAAEMAARLSSCVEGTILHGLNFLKGREDPVALPDAAYPEWLWRCLEVQKKTSEATDANLGDEFSKSKKQRRLAAKRTRTSEAKMLASGDMEALAPKIPLSKQSINLPGSEDGSLADAMVAAGKREDLRRAMRKERKAKIKEDNYLKTM
ncbi:mitochondrial ribosomal protein L37-domain-containing protein [Podospora appendiculata]|uniref:Large ribosomal subunit protein mL54 n=1 Tax=Podospora appendiculata TaxID=314037 RepID=A0AAE0XJW8_9PEZI|nr:mitochondrial ribosomal protein L37-domain-containing protein [Podospora appendiculata]